MHSQLTTLALPYYVRQKTKHSRREGRDGDGENGENDENEVQQLQYKYKPLMGDVNLQIKVKRQKHLQQG